MSIITVATPFNIDLEFKIAPFHKRLLAWLIDILIMYGFIYGMYRFVVPTVSFTDYLGNTFQFLFVFFPAYAYHLLCEIFLDGQSLGKKALGLKVMDKSGNAATISQYLLRWILRLVDIMATMGLGAVISIALTPLNQRLGDLAAGTVVIDRSGQTALHETIYLEIEDKNYQVAFPQVMRLTDRDINGIRNLLDRRVSGREIESYVVQVSDRIKEVLAIETDLDPKDFLHRLLQDYNFLTHK